MTHPCARIRIFLEMYGDITAPRREQNTPTERPSLVLLVFSLAQCQPGFLQDVPRCSPLFWARAEYPNVVHDGAPAGSSGQDTAKAISIPQGALHNANSAPSREAVTDYATILRFTHVPTAGQSEPTTRATCVVMGLVPGSQPRQQTDALGGDGRNAAFGGLCWLLDWCIQLQTCPKLPENQGGEHLHFPCNHLHPPERPSC